MDINGYQWLLMDDDDDDDDVEWYTNLIPDDVHDMIQI